MTETYNVHLTSSLAYYFNLHLKLKGHYNKHCFHPLLFYICTHISATILDNLFHFSNARISAALCLCIFLFVRKYRLVAHERPLSEARMPYFKIRIFVAIEFSVPHFGNNSPEHGQIKVQAVVALWNVRMDRS